MKSREDVLQAIDRALLSNCDPVQFSVSVTLPSLSDTEVEIIELALNQQARDALQTAGILRSGPGTPMLGITLSQAVGTSEPADAFLLSIAFVKPATDDYGNRHLSTAWKLEMALPMSKFDLGADIMQQNINRFVLTYLRVNAAACSDKN